MDMMHAFMKSGHLPLGDLADQVSKFIEYDPRGRLYN
jgi:hypothetical protein